MRHRNYSIGALCHGDVTRFQEHFSRHRAESGRGDQHFLPFAPDDREGPNLDVDALNRTLDEPGWQRWIIAIDDEENIVGHVDLKGDGLKPGGIVANWGSASSASTGEKAWVDDSWKPLSNLLVMPGL